jgi:hypothetical protein
VLFIGHSTVENCLKHKGQVLLSVSKLKMAGMCLVWKMHVLGVNYSSVGHEFSVK